MKSQVLGIALLTLIVANPCLADDWTQWRGPNRADISNESVLKEWPEEGPQQLWTNTNTGLGYGGISVSDGVLYTVGARDTSELLIAVDAATGKEKWSAEIGPLLTNGWGDGPRSTPTVDGDHIYAMSGQGFLVCITSDGKEVWKRQMSDFGGEVPVWGYAESPLVDGEKVVVTPGGSKTTIIALDKMTGKEIWQTKNLQADDKDPKAHYSSIVIAHPHGQKQYVQLMQKRVIAVDPETGEELWSQPWGGSVAVIPTPIVKDNFVYVTSGYGAGDMLLEVADDNSVKVVYKNKVMTNHHGGAILVGDNIYGYSDGAGWTCQEFASGDQVWSEEELGKGCVTSVDGMLIAVDEKTGEVVLFEASDVKWKEHGRFKLDPLSKKRSSRGGIWTHPVVSGGKLFLKDQEILYCYDIAP